MSTKKVYQCEKGTKKGTARASTRNAPASVKFSTELVNQIKGQPLNKVMARLERIKDKKEFLPINRYNTKVAHRKGNALNKVKSGRYPVKTITVWLDLLNSAKANADYKGLNAEKLLIEHAFVSKGYTRIRYQNQGRIAGKARESKSANIEVIVREAA